MAVSVEAAVIGRSCSEGCGFDSRCRLGSFLRLNSRPVMYVTVDSLAWSEILDPFDLGSIPARAAVFNRVITLSKLCTYTFSLANEAIHPFGIGKLVPVNCLR